jgi:hypothetical protein
VEQLDYNLLFRWFVGMSMDEEMWVPTVFTKNRDRLLKHSVANSFFVRVCERLGPMSQPFQGCLPTLLSGSESAQVVVGKGVTRD